MNLPRRYTFGYAEGPAPHIALVDDQARRSLCSPHVPLASDWAFNDDQLCPACAPLVQR
ncbi:hypothetical protein OG455_39220 [Kitasatospora sp. NBC_01287]|uniref:hypothetical protein n=1 Tax=Kitasatospora sp. NBC_01287 TaxID=2903573 RepID=UPI002252937B|nr:hypothetical protein [Kitasatospora sp. NBC_01287]MCX4751468.1 hypothetical protein [Kitasatospora sp. NBC_01287]